MPPMDHAEWVRLIGRETSTRGDCAVRNFWFYVETRIGEAGWCPLTQTVDRQEARRIAEEHRNDFEATRVVCRSWLDNRPMVCLDYFESEYKPCIWCDRLTTRRAADGAAVCGMCDE